MTERREFTQKDLDALKVEYDKAIKENKDQFVFDKHVLLVSYAKYLIEYLESQFKK